MFSSARRHGFSSTKHQDQQHQQKKKKGKPSAGTTTAALSAPPTPSKSKADARTAAQAYAAAAAARPATAAAAVGSFACRPVAHAMTSVSALAAARPTTANGTATASTQQSLAPSPSPSPSPASASSQQGLLRLAMPRASAASTCATPSPLSSGLPSPTLPPLPASHFASQPHGVVSSLSGQPAAPATAHVLRSPVINISHPHHGHGGSPLVHHARKLSANGNGISKDELVFDYRVRPSPHTRKFSVSSVADSVASGSVKSPKSPKSPNSMSETSSPASKGSGRSSMLREDVLAPGDRVGAGLTLQGEVLHPVFNDNENMRRDKEEPATELEVVRRLGAGSYAIVYLVREVLHHPPPGVLDGLNDGDDNDIADRRPGNGRRLSEELELWDVPSELDLDSDPLELDGMRRKKDGDADVNKVYYGKEYAVKVLSKVGMDDEALEAQLVEANIHQSLPIHPNIVTLHRALETPSFLLLVLEFVPGEDLYYFLEQARDHYEPEPSSSYSGSTSSDSEGEEKRHKANTSVLSVNSVNTVGTMNTTRTPPTPSLLSTLNEKQLLGRRRLRLIASMFAQMCEAVAVCHDVGVYHRDIKPENFIVTDGWEEDGERRVVVVKLTDFGLSTRDAASSDMDCGSAPYMSYECRNNCAPTYAPRAADVWSLGIVLINMLYHINPWTDTTQGVCPSFSSFLAAPEHFFMQRFAGMVPAVASFLCQRVFCILPSDDPADSAGRRVSAREFGRWARELPRLMASEEPVGVPPALANIAATANVEQRSQSSLAFPPKETKEKEVEKEGAVTSLSPTLPVSPTSPPSSALLAQSLATVLAQQEAATAAAGSSSPAWRHKRGLSNASVGYALSSVPQSRRPASRQQSFSAERSAVPSSHLGLHGISGLGSAAGSRAATPLLRGRALANGSAANVGAGSNAAGMRSRVPSYCETPAGVVGAVNELPTVFDEGEGDLSSGSLGLELQLGRQRELETERVVEEKGGDEREPLHSEEFELEQEQEPEQEQEQEQEAEAEHDAEDESNATMSRSTSMVRRRKRGARRGKGAIIQQQQMEIARLQQQQEELTRQVMRMQEQLAAQQQQHPHEQPVQTQQQQQETQVPRQEAQVRGKSQERNLNLNLQTQAQVQVLASLNPSPTATTSASGLLAAPTPTKALGQVHSQSLPAVSQKPTGDVLDSLASASEALARELSRAKNVRSGGGVSAGSASSVASVPGSVSSPLLVPMRAISGAGTRESSPARSSISISSPNQHYQPRSTSSSSRPASIRTTSTTTSTTAHVGVGSKLTRQASPSAAMAFAGAGGPTPGAMFPVSFAALSSSSYGKARNGSATTTATRGSNSSSSVGVSVKNEAGNAHTGAGASVGSGAGGVGSNAGMGMVQSQGQTLAPAAAIAKKTSKWKLSFGKGSSSSTHSRAPLPMPVPEVPQQQPDVVLDISGDGGKFKPNAANDAVVAVLENTDEDGYEDENDYDKEGGADADARRQSTSVHAKADAISSEGSAQQHGASSASSTASRVKSVLMSLDADLNSTSSSAATVTTGMNNFRAASGNSNTNANGAEPWSRGRRPAANQHQVRPWDVSSSSSNESRWPAVERERNVSPNSTRTGRSANLSPHSSSTSNAGVLSSSASSLSSSSNANNNKNNWRYSTLTTSSATSGWTRYSGSNASMRSVSTVATSVSGASGTGSWRNGAGNVNRSDASLASGSGGGEGRKPGHYTAPGGSGGGPGSIASRKSDKSSLSGMPPPNVKIMTGVPWALDELPRQLHPNPSGDIFGMPPTARKQRVRKPKDLPTISERPNSAHTIHAHNNNNFNASSAQQQQHPYNNSGSRAPPNKSPLSQHVDAARSSTSLHRSSGEGVVGLNEFGEPVVRESEEREREREGAAPRKVQKGQINALAKMLSALRR